MRKLSGGKMSWDFPSRALLMAALGVIAIPALARPAGHAPSTAAERDAAWQQHASMRAQSPFAGLDWRSIGPTKQSGRVVAIAGVPGRPYTFYVAYATGGVWKTSDNGAHFTPLSDRMPTLVTGAIAVDPNHPDTLWVGTGEANSSRSSYGGMGVYRSDDGGKTFQFAGLPDSDRIARIVIDPKDSNTVYAAALGKLYSEGGQRGVFRTRDGGKTWQQVLTGSTPWTGAIDLTIDPRNPQVLYAALWDRSRTAWNMVYSGKGSGIWKSTDGGDHWMPLTQGFPHDDKVGRIGLAIAPSQPDSIYASVDDWTPLPPDQRDAGDGPLSPARLKMMGKDQFLRQDPQQIERFIRESDLDTNLTAAKLIGMVRDGTVTMDQLRKQLSDANADLFNTDIEGLVVYRSDDDGAHWHKANQEPLRDVYYTYGYYFGQIRVAPNDPNHVYAEGLPLIESKDGGKTWSGLNDESVHVDYHELLIDPADPQRMLVGNDGGANITYDGGAHWQKFGNLPVGQFYSVTYDMADPYNVYGGLQDNGAMMGSSKTDWQRADNWKDVGGGDGMYVQVDPRDNKTIYAGFQFGFYTRTGPGGEHEVRPRPAFGSAPLRWNWTTPTALSPHNQDIVYMGANRLFRSLDKAESWQAVSPDLTTSRNRGNVPYATITTLAESPKIFGLLWAGTDDGHVWVTRDGGVQWSEVDDALPLRWVSRVEPSHFDDQRAYVSLNGYRDDDITPYLYRSDDLGKHWTDISRGLPREAINVVREDPVNADVLYVGTDRGVYASLDRGKSWLSLQANLPNVPVLDLTVHPRERELIAGTHGRSVWIVDALPAQELTPALQAQSVHLFPAEGAQASHDWQSRPAEWFDETPDLPKLEGTYWAKSAGPVKLTVLDADGQPVRKLDLQAQRGVNSYTWNLELDKTLALAAERARLAKENLDLATADFSRQPIAQAVQTGWRLYPPPGKYTLKLEGNGTSSSTKFEVKAPDDYKPRAKQPPKMRGKDKWTRPQAQPEPSAASEEREAEKAGQ
ncbi:MAG: hypothetical protein ABI132_04125 [Rhodanobacteraceae bacterium]